MHTLNPFVCGTFHDEYYDEPRPASAGSSPRKYKRKYSRNDNPYSARGLDKFSALLADLDVKRQYIYSRMSPHEISFVRFVYNHSDDIVPVVVKVKSRKNQKHESRELKVVRAGTLDHTSEELSLEKKGLHDRNPSQERKKTKVETHLHTKVAKNIIFSWKMGNSWDVGAPSFYLPLVIIMILLLLLVFGRTVTIAFTTIMLYIVGRFRTTPPRNLTRSMRNDDRVRGSNGGSGKRIVGNEGAKKQKEIVREFSERKMEVGETSKKMELLRGSSERKMEVSEGNRIKKELVRWWSEKKMVISEGSKKFLDRVRRESEKKVVPGERTKKFLDCIRGESGADTDRNSPRNSPRNDVDSPRSGADDSPRSGADSEDSSSRKKNKKKGSKDKNPSKKD